MEKSIFVSLYYYLIDFVNIEILSVNFFSKTTKSPKKENAKGNYASITAECRRLKRREVKQYF